MLSSLVASLLLAAEPSVPVVRQTVVVTAERGEDEITEIPSAVTVIDREELAHAPVRSLADIAAIAPGVVTLSGDGMAGRPIVLSRGFFGGGEVDYLKVLIGEAPLRSAESGLVDWSRVQASRIDRVEILRGPASAVWGDAAMGGIVRVTPRRDGAGTRIDLEGGSSGLGALMVDHETALAGGALGLFASGERTSGWRSNTGFEQLLGGVSYRSQESPWSVGLQIGSSEREEPGALELDRARSAPRSSLDYFADDQVDSQFASATASAMLSRLPLHLSVSGERRSEEVVRTILLAPGLPDRKRRDLDASSLALSAVGEWGIGSVASLGHRIRAGADAGRDRVDSIYSEAGDAADPLVERDARRTITAAFITDYWSIADPLDLIIGARWDHVRDDFSGDVEPRTESALSPRIGFSWRPSGTLAVYGQAARSFKAPTLDQMFDGRPFPDFRGGSFTISNPDLVPQRATSVELGASGGARVHWQTSVYRMDVEDEIDFDISTFRYGNIGSTAHTGLELSAALPGSAWIRPQVAWSWSRVEPRAGENRGRQLKNIPEHALRASADLTLPWSLRADAAYTLLAGRYLDDANRVPLDDAHVLDLRISRNVAGWSAYVDLLNLTGSEYIEYGYTLMNFDGTEVPFGYPAAGTRVRVGVSRRF